MGWRLPMFDIKVSAQKRNPYSTVSQNELALQFFRMGFFDPARAEQAMLCLEMMDFDGKDLVMQKVARLGQLGKQLEGYRALCLELARQAEPAKAGALPESAGKDPLEAARIRTQSAAL